MVLYWFELKKLLASAAVWGFLAACLLFNMIVVIVQGHDDYADVVGAVSNVVTTTNAAKMPTGIDLPWVLLMRFTMKTTTAPRTPPAARPRGRRAGRPGWRGASS